MIWLGRRCCCSADLYFPFETANNEFKEYLAKIEMHLPFKLEKKYLKLGRPNKKRTSNIYTTLYKTK